VLGGVWSLKPLNGNAIWLDDRFMSPRISPVSSQENRLPVTERIPHTYGHALHTISHKRDPRLIIDFTARRGFPSFQRFCFLVREHHCAASIPRLHPPISVHLLPLQCIPSPPFLLSSSARPLSNAVVASNPPIRRSSRKILIVWLFCLRL
jgi:hypothetical protein